MTNRDMREICFYTQEALIVRYISMPPAYCSIRRVYFNSQDVKGQGAVVLPAPPCMWIYHR